MRILYFLILFIILAPVIFFSGRISGINSFKEKLFGENQHRSLPKVSLFYHTKDLRSIECVYSLLGLRDSKKRHSSFWWRDMFDNFIGYPILVFSATSEGKRETVKRNSEYSSDKNLFDFCYPHVGQIEGDLYQITLSYF